MIISELPLYRRNNKLLILNYLENVLRV